MIRGKSYEECLIMLEFMPYRACEPVLNALFSAASNAKNNLGMNKAKLYVSVRGTFCVGTFCVCCALALFFSRFFWHSRVSDGYVTWTVLGTGCHG